MKLYVVEVNSLCEIALSSNPEDNISRISDMHDVSEPKTWISEDKPDYDEPYSALLDSMYGVANSSNLFDITFEEAKQLAEEHFNV